MQNIKSRNKKLGRGCYKSNSKLNFALKALTWLGNPYTFDCIKLC